MKKVKEKTGKANRINHCLQDEQLRKSKKTICFRCWILLGIAFVAMITAFILVFLGLFFWSVFPLFFLIYLCLRSVICWKKRFTMRRLAKQKSKNRISRICQEDP